MEVELHDLGVHPPQLCTEGGSLPRYTLFTRGLFFVFQSLIYVQKMLRFFSFFLGCISFFLSLIKGAKEVKRNPPTFFLRTEIKKKLRGDISREKKSRWSTRDQFFKKKPQKIKRFKEKKYFFSLSHSTHRIVTRCVVPLRSTIFCSFKRLKLKAPSSSFTDQDHNLVLIVNMLIFFLFFLNILL